MLTRMDAADPPGEPTTDRPSADIDRRVNAIVHRAEIWHLADALSGERTTILDRWLEAAGRQPFHQQHPDRAVADHIPSLFDAIVDLLRRSRSSDEGPSAPMEDDAVTAAATGHAQARFEQGLGPVAIVTEFRLLRQEIGRSMAATLDDRIDVRDIVAGLTIVGDALDGAATIGLTSLSDRIEDLRETFLAATLHDVRQPITLVEGSLLLADRWLDGGDPDVGRLSEAVDDALLATLELVDMIDTLSDASRVAMGALRLETEPVILDHVVRERIAALGATARDRVHLQVRPGRLMGAWDPTLIRRLLANLIGNALKYSAPGTPVEVEVRPGDGDTAVLEIRDRGIGLEGRELADVFDRFTRTDRARRSGANGLGLGLYACRGIVEAHGGSINVRSDGYDQGASFIVSLPTMSIAALEATPD